MLDLENEPADSCWPVQLRYKYHMKQKNTKSLLSDVSNYYSTKLAQHGSTPEGVDWNGSESQEERFYQLAKIIGESDGFSVCDLGCGYGAFYDYLARSRTSFSYVGVDISEDMVCAARQRHKANDNARYVTAEQPDQISDYCVASGIFNVKMEYSSDEWRSHIESMLDILDGFSRKGFAFNCLTSYSDADKMKQHLYYAVPGEMFDYCKQRFSRNVALLHDYDLYEFTMLVRKEL